MNHYLIWTDEGWLRTPTYNHIMCFDCFDLYLNGIDSAVNTTHNIRHAYKLNAEQAKDCLAFLQRYGVASWSVEVKEDMLEKVLKEMEQKRKEKNQ